MLHRNYMALHRNIALSIFHGLLHQSLKPATARHAHAQHRELGYLSRLYNGREFFQQGRVVFEFWASDDGNAARYPVLVQVWQGKTGAVGGQQHMRALEKGGSGRHKAQLYGP